MKLPKQPSAMIRSTDSRRNSWQQLGVAVFVTAWMLGSPPVEGKPAAEPGVGIEPPQFPIDDPGQLPIPAHGDSPETATRLLVNMPDVSGTVGNVVQVNGAKVIEEADFFVFTFDAGTMYKIAVQSEPRTFVSAGLLDRDGKAVLQSKKVGSGDARPEGVWGWGLPVIFSFSPPAHGDYFLKVSSLGSPAQYSIRVSQDAPAAR